MVVHICGPGFATLRKDILLNVCNQDGRVSQPFAIGRPGSSHHPFHGGLRSHACNVRALFPHPLIHPCNHPSNHSAMLVHGAYRLAGWVECTSPQHTRCHTREQNRGRKSCDPLLLHYFEELPPSCDTHTHTCVDRGISISPRRKGGNKKQETRSQRGWKRCKIKIMKE